MAAAVNDFRRQFFCFSRRVLFHIRQAMRIIITFLLFRQVLEQVFFFKEKERKKKTWNVWIFPRPQSWLSHVSMKRKMGEQKKRSRKFFIISLHLLPVYVSSPIGNVCLKRKNYRWPWLTWPVDVSSFHFPPNLSGASFSPFGRIPFHVQMWWLGKKTATDSTTRTSHVLFCFHRPHSLVLWKRFVSDWLDNQLQRVQNPVPPLISPHPKNLCIPTKLFIFLEE